MQLLPNAFAVRRRRIREDISMDRREQKQDCIFKSEDRAGSRGGVLIDRMLLFFSQVSGVNNV